MNMDRQLRGLANFHAGSSAEDRIERAYLDRGHALLARRWRGGGAEIDLIMQKDGALSFVEVKKARSFERAAESLRPAQARRIAIAAEVFLATQPNGSLTECSFDVGLVDQAGAHHIIENAFAVH